MQQRTTRRTGAGPRRRDLPWPVIAGLGFFVVIALAVGLEVWRSSRGGSATAVPGSPVVVANVEVARPVADSGQVPLNTPVEESWLLRNTGTTPVTLGRPSIEVLEGC